MSFNVTCHAIDRYRVQHPYANNRLVVRAVENSIEIDTPVALKLAGRNPEKSTRSRYLLAPDRGGMFVLEKDGYTDTVITFLRFGQVERAFTLRHWPIPTTSSSKRQTSETLAIIEAPVSTVVISSKLTRVFGSSDKTKIALFDAEVLSELPYLYLLLVGPVRVQLEL